MRITESQNEPKLKTRFLKRSFIEKWALVFIIAELHSQKTQSLKLPGVAFTSHLKYNEHCNNLLMKKMQVVSTLEKW